jgi:hypothetical protein
MKSERQVLETALLELQLEGWKGKKHWINQGALMMWKA